MTHFAVAVILPPETPADDEEAIRGKVAELLARYDENGQWFRDGSRWDWWMVGGRWDGEIRGLEPLTVYEGECELCHGTGTRPDWPADCTPEWIAECNGCNGCHGEGKRRAWPTHEAFSTLARNLTRVREMKMEPLAYVLPTGEWVEKTRKGFCGMDIPDENGCGPAEKIGAFDQAEAELRDLLADCLVVAVDCHV